MPVEVVVRERVPVPPDLLAESPKQAIPDTLTFGQAIELWSEDRASLDTVNGQLRGIKELSE